MSRKKKFYTRRDAMKIGSLGALGLSLGDMLRVEAAQKWFESKEGKCKSVIQILCQGGIAAQESWNPKPEAPLEYRGPFGVNKTPIPGIVMSEMVPELSKIADKLCVVRSVTGKEIDHGRAMYAMMTGYRMSPAIKHPAMGSIVNHEFGARAGFPGLIAIPGAAYGAADTGYLSPKYGAFATGEDPAQGNGFKVRDLKLPSGVTDEMFSDRRGLREMMNNQFRKLESNSEKLDTMDSFYKQAYTMLSSDKVKDAFDLSKESDKTKEAYGYGRFLENGHYGTPYGSQAGMRCLLARRLVEAGARFVTLNFGGWDNHVRLREVYEKQMPPLDNAVAMLIKDLDQRGLLDSTLVWIVSEFGRTPKINAAAGRDHYARVFSSLLAGGGLKRGLFYGDSDITSSEIAKNPVPIQDLHSTLYHLMGINSEKELMAPGSRPMEIVADGHVIKDLIA